jgi:hypothetical protein
MGKLQQIKEENPNLFRSASSGDSNYVPPSNIPLRLESYEGDKYFIGTNLETKEKMKIHLMDIEQKNATKQKRRPELPDFREPSNKNLYAEPGKAIMLFESCYPDRNEEGVYVSRWASRISSDPKETQIVIADASLIYGKKKNNDAEEEYILLRTIHPTKATEVGDIDTLRSVMAKLLTPTAPGSTPFVYIRITDDEGDVEVLSVLSKRVEREDGLGKKAADGEESADEFLESEKSELVKMLIEDPDVKIEVFPARALFPGTATKDKMLDAHPNAKKVLQESFYIKLNNKDVEEGGEGEEGEEMGEQSESSETQGNYPEIGFLKCCIAVRSHADGTPYFTHVKPLRPFDQAVSVKTIKNPNSGV